MDIKEFLDNIEEPLLKADGFDHCILGVASGCGMPTALLYDEAKVITTLMDRDGMDIEEAHEFFDFNIAGAFMGEGTPMFLTKVPED